MRTNEAPDGFVKKRRECSSRYACSKSLQRWCDNNNGFTSLKLHDKHGNGCCQKVISFAPKLSTME